MFTYFTDRDGKFQLCALRRVGFDPLARTTQVHADRGSAPHVRGRAGVSRVIQRTCQVMNELKTDDAQKLRAAGVIDLPTLQRYLNFHYSVTHRPVRRRPVEQRRDLLQLGPQGPLRGRQARRRPPAQGPDLQGARSAGRASSSRRTCRCSTRSTRCCATTSSRIRWPASGRWNKVIEKAGIPYRLTGAAQGLPPQHRRAGRHARCRRTAGVVERCRVGRQEGEWLPTDEDRAFVAQPDGPRGRARQVRQLDRAAGDGHQPAARSTSDYVRFD